MKEGKFNFFVPIDEESIRKAAEAPIENRYDNMVLEGLASDDTEDTDKEVLEPDGFITDYFLQSGTVNYEHLAKKSPKYIIGEPIDAKVTNNKFYVKAKLWKQSQIARDLWDKVLEMRESGSKRKLGWSIEGKSLLKNPLNQKNIKRALITNIALTFNPVNANSWADIVKGQQKEDFVELDYETTTEEAPYLYEFERNGKVYRLSPDYQIYAVGIEKAMDIAATKPLIPESLDKKPKNLCFNDIKKAIDTVVKMTELGIADEGMLKKLKEIW